MVDSKKQAETIDAPLVSVLVITYNSAAYVLETLESAKVQTYQNIELIITDDGSSDDTVEICRQWLDENNSRFVRTELITSSVNTGIPANCNRGNKACCGEWVKGIAGDDLLVPDAIENYVAAVSDNIYCLVGKMQCFCTNTNDEIVYKKIYPVESDLSFFYLSASRQHRKLLTDSFNFSPAVFMRKSVYNSCGEFNENFKYLDDLPYWLRITDQGIKFNYLPKITVLYRTQHESTVFVTGKFYNLKFMSCLFSFRKKIVYPQVPFWNLFFYESEVAEYLRYFVMTRIFRNKRNHITHLIYAMFSILSFRSWRNYLKGRH